MANAYIIKQNFHQNTLNFFSFITTEGIKVHEFNTFQIGT